MTSSTPLVTPDDLATYLNDPQINVDRAAQMIDLSQSLCESIVSPLPDAAKVVVIRVAARAYVTTTSTRSAQAAAAGSPFGAAPGGAGGPWLSRDDERTLRRLAGGGNAFNIDMLPPDYVLPCLPPWDNGDVGFDSWETWGL